MHSRNIALRTTVVCSYSDQSSIKQLRNLRYLIPCLEELVLALEVGNIVHIFAGAELPVVSRPCGPNCAMRNDEAEGIHQSRMSRLFGQCYIHRIIMCEAMPLDF